MPSDGKSYNCKVLRHVETDDFDIRIVPIRVRMQKLHVKSCAAAVFGRIIRAGDRIIREIEALKTTEGLSLSRMIRVEAGQSG